MTRRRETDGFMANEDGMKATTVDEIKSKLVNLKPQTLDTLELIDDFKFLRDQLMLEQMKAMDEKQMILLNDTLSICMARMYQKNADFNLSLVEINVLFDYIKDYMNQASSALSNSLNAILKRLVDHTTKFNENNQLILQHWLDSLIQNPTKSNLRLFEILLKYLDDKFYVLNNHPEFVSNLLRMISDKSLTNSISKLIILVYQNTYSSTEKYDVWLESWKPMVLQALRDEKLKNNIISYLLPGLIKINPLSLNKIIDDVGKNDIELLISFLKIGQNLHLFENPYQKIDKDLFQLLLVHENPYYRIDALTLLLGSMEKNVKSLPIQPEIYDTFFKCHILDTFLNEYENIEVRNKFIAIMQNFLNGRFRESMYSLKKKSMKDLNALKLVNYGEEFLDSLFFQLIQYLEPSSNYSQLSSSMNLIYIILKGPINFLSFKNFDNLPYLLFQNLFNDYENIRELSCNILNIYPNLIFSGEITQDLLIQSNKALQDLGGRKSEGGAKVIEFLSQYYYNQPMKVQSMVDNLIGKIKDGIENETYVHGYFKALSLIPAHYLIDQYPIMIPLINSIWKMNKELLTSEELFETEEFNESEGKLNYSWKVVKESNLLLSILLKQAELPNEEFLSSCEMIMEQIAEIKHRGVVQSIYSSFIEACKLCLERDDLKQYPETWLKRNLSLIEFRTQAITRRSGGIPYLIAGIIVSTRTKRLDFLDATFQKLVAIAQEPSEYLADQRNDIPQVHAFNCLKQLISESLLTKECMKYAQICLELSLKHFNANNWSVRNCAVMLFGSIQKKIFGNSTQYPCQLFFKKFKGLDVTLKLLLNEELENGGNTNPIVIPISIIISQLFITDDDEIAKELKFILFNYLSSKNYKVREIVGKCMSSLLTSKELLKLILDLFDLPSLENNYIHGCLITVLESIQKSDRGGSEVFYIFLKNIQVYCHNNVLFNYIIKIIHTLATRYSIMLDQKNLDYLGNVLISKGTDNVPGGEIHLTICSIIELLVLQYLMSGDEQKAVDPITFGLSLNYKVQIFLLEFLEKLPNDLCEQLHEAIWKIIEDEDVWSYVKGLALTVFSNIIISKRITKDKIKFDILHNLIKHKNQNVSLGALKCIGAFSGNHDEIILICLENCLDHQPFENRFASITCLIHISRGKTEEATLAIFLLYTYGLSDEDETIRSRSSSFFKEYFGYQEAINPTFIQYDAADRLVHLANTIFGKVAIQLILELQLTPINSSLYQPCGGSNSNFQHQSQLQFSALYGSERENLYKNDVILVQNLLKILNHVEIEKISNSLISRFEKVLNTVNQMKLPEDRELISWHRDEFIYIPIVKVTIIGKCLANYDESIQKDLQLLESNLRRCKGEKILDNF